MTLPSDEELHALVTKTPEPDDWVDYDTVVSSSGIAAVKRAVIEALAQEADGRFHEAFMFNGSDTMSGLWMEVSGWLRSHLPEGSAR